MGDDMMKRRNEARTVVNQMNAEAVVALLERQNQIIREYGDRLSAMEARIQLLEASEQLRLADKFARMAQGMGSGSTSG